MQLAALEQQRELTRYMNSLNEWLGHDVEDRQAELRGVAARLDQLRDDVNRLGATGMTRESCRLHTHMSLHMLILPSNFLQSCRQGPE